MLFQALILLTGHRRSEMLAHFSSIDIRGRDWLDSLVNHSVFVDLAFDFCFFSPIRCVPCGPYLWKPHCSAFAVEYCVSARSLRLSPPLVSGHRAAAPKSSACKGLLESKSCSAPLEVSLALPPNTSRDRLRNTRIHNGREYTFSAAYLCPLPGTTTIASSFDTLPKLVFM